MKTVLVSFPRCGRTWLKMLVGLSLSKDPANMKEAANEVLDTTHDRSDKSLKIHYKDLPTDKSQYQDRRVLLLLREPKDQIVSCWLHASKNKRKYKGTLEEYIRDPRYGIYKLITFYNNWCNWPCYPVWYEDLVENPFYTLDAVLEYMGVCGDVSYAISTGTMENLQQWEREGGYIGVHKPKRPEDKDSYYFRRGKIGGYVDYMTDKDIAYCEEAIRQFRWYRG